MKQKVLQNGYKYPQNSFHPFFRSNINSFKLNTNITISDRNSTEVNIFANYLRVLQVEHVISCTVYQHNKIYFWIKNVTSYYALFTSERSQRFFFNERLKIYLGYRTIFRNVKYLSLRLINLLLLRAGIESNPGPNIDALKIITVNCNGLTNDLRLMQAIGRLKNNIRHCSSVIFLQETHNANLMLLENLWQGNVNVAVGTGGSRGVITLTTSDIVVKSFESDPEGRYIFTTIYLGKEYYINTANIYSPNNHGQAKNFYNTLFNNWDEYCNEVLRTLPTDNNLNSIIAGDLNCVINNSDLQNRNRTSSEKELAEVIESHMSNRGLLDSVLRSSNGNNFTWNRGNTFSKIDYIFVSHQIVAGIKAYDTVWDLVKSDHAAICLKVELYTIPNKGRSYPKLSALDISNSNDREELRREISEAITNFPKHWDPHQKLDYIKVVIRTKVLEIRSYNKITEAQLDSLRRELDEYSKYTYLSEAQANAFNNLRITIHNEEERQAEKLRIIAGVKWREEGERSTKYFLNSVKVREAFSLIDFLQTDHGKLDKPREILEYAKGFYEELYSLRPTIVEDRFFEKCPKLSAEATSDLDKELTIEELLSTLKTCKDSTPGLDGIPYSYYKTYASLLLPLILDAWKFTRTVNKLPESQLTSCISLIPKAGKDKHNIKNWRPISLSSCDLKIITKAMSLKVGRYLKEIISESQMGYVPGRDINFNNRLMRSAMAYCTDRNLDYILTSLDAQKAYDSVSHDYISKVLKAYNFPDSFINSVDVLNSNLKALVQVNGHMSIPFSINRGVKQGDALSCALFIISIDPLIRNIESNILISPLTMAPGCMIKTLAYADDIAVITTNCDSTLNEVFKEYNRLTQCSGLRLNADKTEIINLSIAGKRRSVVNYDNLTIQIEHGEAVTVCGNYISVDENAAYQKNITEKIIKLEQQLNRWKGRNLTINGRMIIIKTFAISQLIFSSQFQIIRPKDLRRIEHLCYTFMWNGRDRVRRTTIKSERQNGGINGIDVESFFRSIAVRQYIKSNNNLTLSIINNSSVIREDIKTLARVTLRRILLKQVLEYDNETEWLGKLPTTLLVKPYSIAHKLMESLNIGNVGSIKFDNFTRGTANKIRRCLPVSILTLIDQGNLTTHNDMNILLNYENKWFDIKKIQSKTLNFLIKQNLNKVVVYDPAARYNIKSDSFVNIRATWQHLWLIKNPTLRAVRHKILYKDVWCNDKRFKLGISKDDKCIICGNKETTFHQLFECTNARRCWAFFENLTGAKIDNNERGYASLIAVSNDLILEVIKACIFKFLIQIDRSSESSLSQLSRLISFYLKIEYTCVNKIIKNNGLQTRRLNNFLQKLEVSSQSNVVI